MKKQFAFTKCALEVKGDYVQNIINAKAMYYKILSDKGSPKGEPV